MSMMIHGIFRPQIAVIGPQIGIGGDVAFRHVALFVRQLGHDFTS
jgi:hypothetical protein